jgi:hypothetical protein
MCHPIIDLDAQQIMTGARPDQQASNEAIPTLDGVIIKVSQILEHGTVLEAQASSRSPS